MRFISSVVEGRLIVSNRKKSELLQELAREGYELFDNRATDENGEGAEEESDLGRGYDYLLSMKIWNLTLEKVSNLPCLALAFLCLYLSHLPRPSSFQQVQELKEQLASKEAELEALRATTPADLWLRDLDRLEECLTEYNDSLEFDRACDIANKKGGRGKPKKG